MHGKHIWHWFNSWRIPVNFQVKTIILLKEGPSWLTKEEMEARQRICFLIWLNLRNERKQKQKRWHGTKNRTRSRNDKALFVWGRENNLMKIFSRQVRSAKYEYFQHRIEQNSRRCFKIVRIDDRLNRRERECKICGHKNKSHRLWVEKQKIKCLCKKNKADSKSKQTDEAWRNQQQVVNPSQEVKAKTENSQMIYVP